MTIPNIGQVVQAIYTRLDGDTTLTDLLGTFESNSCIFEGIQVPSAAPRPYVSIRPVDSIRPFDSKNFNGSELNFTIGCFTDETETTIVLEQITNRINRLLHRSTLTLATDTNVFIELTGSGYAPSSSNISGHLLFFTIIIL